MQTWACEGYSGSGTFSLNQSPWQCWWLCSGAQPTHILHAPSLSRPVLLSCLLWRVHPPLTVTVPQVLCSVPSPQQVLREVHRVLKPGGQLLLIEHVIAPQLGLLQLQQRLLNPLQRLLADNCHLSRDTAAVVQSSGLQLQPLPPLPVVKGILGSTLDGGSDGGDHGDAGDGSRLLPGGYNGGLNLWRFEVDSMGLIAPHIAGILRKAAVP